MIYADYNATAPVPESVVDAMAPFHSRVFLNPSQRLGALGSELGAALDHARQALAGLLDADPEDIVFTSGGTESCSSAILGALAARPERKRVLSSTVEHPAVRETALFAAGSLLGRIAEERSHEALPRELDADAAVVSAMLANNETGIRYDLNPLVRAARGSGVCVHCDATQAVGKVPVSFRRLGADLLSVSGHKFGGPKGIGVLVIRKDAPWRPLSPGGGQQRGRRGGTLPAALIVGLGRAAELARERLAAGETERLGALRAAFEKSLTSRLNCEIVGADAERLPNTSCVHIPGVLASELVEELAGEGLYISAGSACSSGAAKPSHVLLSMGKSAAFALSTVRVSLGAESSEHDVREAAERLARKAEALRGRLEGKMNFRELNGAHGGRL